MAKEAKNIITTICDEHCNMSDRLLPKHCAALIAEVSTFKNHTFNDSKSIFALEMLLEVTLLDNIVFLVVCADILMYKVSRQAPRGS